MRIDTKDRHWEVMCLYTQDNKMETCYRVGVGLDCGVTQAWISTLTLPLISSVIRNKLVQVKTLVSWQDLIILNIGHSCSYFEVSQAALGVKNPPANAGDIRDKDSIPGLGRPSGGGHGNPLQYSGLVNPMDRGIWWATVHRVIKNQTWLKWLSRHTFLCYTPKS